MVKGKLDNGFEYNVDETLATDMEFLELFSASSEDDPFAFFKAVKIMFPGDEKKRLYDFVRDKKTNRVPVEKVAEIIGQIVQEVRTDGKK